jgi:two-component system CheB/CheR fusion protein
MSIVERSPLPLSEIIETSIHEYDKIAAQPKLRTVFVVEDDPVVCEVIEDFLGVHGFAVESFQSAESFLRDYHDGPEACLLVDLRLNGNMSGLDLLSHLKNGRYHLPAIVISGNSNPAIAVDAMKLGAADYLLKPIISGDLLTCIERVLAHCCYRCRYTVLCIARDGNQDSLTLRQKQILNLILRGHPSKNIADDLGISQRTVESHRSKIMKKTKSKSIPQLARICLATPWNGVGESPPCFAKMSEYRVSGASVLGKQ